MKKIFCLLLVSCLLLLSKSSAASKFSFRISGEDVFFITENNSMFLVQPSSIICNGNMLYFAAQDFTAKKDLTVEKTKDIKVIVDEENRKVAKATFLLADDKKGVQRDYELVLFLETRKEFPFLVIYSKFVYTGSGTNECGINWAVDSTHDPFKYYTIPQKGENKAVPLVKTRRTKIGQANWIFVHNGKGVGAGIIAPAAVLGRGEDFIFLTSVPPKKKLKRGESLDVFIIFMPINKNFKTLPEIFERIKTIKWEYK
ncbi:MAG: hypothetical protein JW957_00140 [Candidatus Omnitrophica bacterium]|nr:hypothetical protein [Candidatus Omnitrophota bacterium]